MLIFSFIGHFLTVLFGKKKKKKNRSNCPQVFYNKGALKNFARFTGKHLCQSLFFFLKYMPATLFKKRLWRKCFPVNFAKFLRTPIFTEHLWWLFLKN